jgi:hypothetical protein
MARYSGPIKLVIMDIASTVCDGPQDLRHLYPNDDGLAVKRPVISEPGLFNTQTAVRPNLDIFDFTGL